MFTIGQGYTRAEIHKKVGGSTLVCLPAKNQQVTCICITKEMNPDAPYIILAGKGSTTARSVGWLVEQETELPVFIKESINNWVYQGQFKVKKCVTGKKKIRKQYRLAGRTDVQTAIEMEEATR